MDYYDKYTTDLLREKYLPLSSSYDKMWVNDGNIRNRGFELTLDGDIVSRKNTSFSATFIFSRNRNEVTDLGNAVSSGLSTDYLTGMQYEVCGQSLSMFNGNPSVYAIGYPMYVFYGYRVNGIIQQGEDPGFMSSDGKDQPGELKYVDLNGDYAIDDRDRCIIGDPNPDFTASLNLSFRYKNLDVSVFLNGVFGNDVIYNGYTYDPRVKIKRWTPDNPTNEYPRLNSTRSYLFSDYFVHDGSFVRLQNINIGYTIPVRKAFIRSVRVFANIENAYTFTKFDGYDPEVGCRRYLLGRLSPTAEICHRSGLEILNYDYEKSALYHFALRVAHSVRPAGGAVRILFRRQFLQERDRCRVGSSLCLQCPDVPRIFTRHLLHRRHPHRDDVAQERRGG